MDRKSRHRIRKGEELLSAALKERGQRLKQSAEIWRTQARSHATAVAAIVLSGQPSVDEPLNLAWGAGFAALRDSRQHRSNCGRSAAFSHYQRRPSDIYGII